MAGERIFAILLGQVRVRDERGDPSALGGRLRKSTAAGIFGRA